MMNEQTTSTQNLENNTYKICVILHHHGRRIAHSSEDGCDKCHYYFSEVKIYSDKNLPINKIVESELKLFIRSHSRSCNFQDWAPYYSQQINYDYDSFLSESVCSILKRHYPKDSFIPSDINLNYYRTVYGLHEKDWHIKHPYEEYNYWDDLEFIFRINEVFNLVPNCFSYDEQKNWFRR